MRPTNQVGAPRVQFHGLCLGCWDGPVAFACRTRFAHPPACHKGRGTNGAAWCRFPTMLPATPYGSQMRKAGVGVDPRGVRVLACATTGVAAPGVDEGTAVRLGTGVAVHDRGGGSFRCPDSRGASVAVAIGSGLPVAEGVRPAGVVVMTGCGTGTDGVGVTPGAVASPPASTITAAGVSPPAVAPPVSTTVGVGTIGGGVGSSPAA